MAAEAFFLPFPTAFNSNGLPSAGAKVYFYLTGTTTPSPVYQEVGLTTTHTNPVTADGAGRLPQIFLDGTVTYKVIIRDAAGNQLGSTLDPYVPGVFASDESISYLSSSGGSAIVGFTQSGTGAITRTLQAKGRDRVSIKDFGASGDGVTDETATALVAHTYAASIGADLFFPAGTYWIDDLALIQQGSGVSLIGESNCGLNDLSNSAFKGSVIKSTKATGNVLTCDGGAGVANRAIQIRNLSFHVATSGYAISLDGAPEGTSLENVFIYNANATGGSAIYAENCWSGLKLSNVHAKALAKTTATNGIYIFNTQKAGTYTLIDCGFNGFDEGYRIGGFVYAVKMINANAESCNIGLSGREGCSFEADNCHYEFNTKQGILLEGTQSAKIRGCTFYNNGTTGSSYDKSDIFFSTGGTNTFNYGAVIENCESSGLTSGANFIGVEFSPYASGVIRNNAVTTVLGASTIGAYIEGTALVNFVLEDNSFGSCATPYNPTSGFRSFSTQFAGFTGIQFASTAVPSNNVNTLDDYEEGTWTPVLGGDGGQSGQVYTTQVGHYQKVGNTVHFSFFVQLSTLGTVTGLAVLRGIPFTINASSGPGYASISRVRNLGTAMTILGLYPNNGSDKYYFEGVAAAATSTAEIAGTTLFSNTTIVQGGGSFIVA